MPGIAVSTGSFAGRKKARRLFTTVASSLIAALSGFTTAVAGGTSTAVESPSGTLTLTVDASNNMAYADKQVTGLTIGKTYELSVRNTHATFSAQVSIGTTQGGTQTGVNGFFALANIVTKMTFVATATTHWIRFYRGAQGTVTLQDATVTTREVPAWALGGLPIVDLDFENSRFLINGKVFTRIADMISAGVLLYNVSGTMIFKLDTPISTASYHRADHTNDNTTTFKTLYEFFDSATGGNLGAGAAQNQMRVGWFWDGANRIITWNDLAQNVEYSTGMTWTRIRPAATRGYITTRSNTNLFAHVVNEGAVLTDTTSVIPSGIDRIVVGNNRALDRPSNSGVNGEAIHRFTVWEGLISDTNLSALATRQRTNMMSYSDDVSNAIWAKTATNVTADNTAGPSGAVTADLLTETLNTAIVTHAATRAIPGWVYTGYIDLKAGTATWVRVIFGNPTTNGFEMWVNLATGAKGTIQARGSGWALIDSAVTPLANGFHRCRITFVPSDNAIGASVMSATADASTTKAVTTYYVGGVQVSRSNDIEPYVARAA